MEVTVAELGQLINPRATEQVSQANQDLGPQILILHRGWVVVGNVTRIGPRLSVENCHVIRTWGTTNGLGEIAKNGPTSTTKLDEPGNLSLLESNCIAAMECNASKWKAVLS